MNTTDAVTYYDDLTRRAYERITSDGERDPHHYSVSCLGRCLRQQAYQVAGTPVSDVPVPLEKAAANHGRAIHAMLVPVLVELAGQAAGEQPVVLRAGGLEVPGRYDLWHYDPARATVVDVKTVGDYRADRVSADGPSREDLMQIRGYATALVQAGHTVESMVWIYVHRATGRRIVVAMPYTPDDGVLVVEHVGYVRELAAAPDSAPREGPGLSAWTGRAFSPCDECPWVSRCWGLGEGERASVMPQAAQEAVLADAGEVAAVESYVAARTAAQEAADAKGFWNTVLRGLSPGVYGAWSYGRTSRGAIKITAAVNRTT